jgi:capsular polysaccharide transport system permease protein
MLRTEPSASPARRMLDAVELQGIVIGAAMLREIHTRYGRENLGFVWMIAEPFLFCLGVMGLWIIVHGQFDQHGVPILAFVMTGYLPLTLWRNSIHRAVHCCRANAPLLYHRQVKMADLLIARVLLEFYGVVLAYIVISFIFNSLDLYELPREWAMFYIGWLYMLVWTMALAMIVSALTETHEWSEKLIGPFVYFMMPASGAFFMLDWLPEPARDVLQYLPTVQAFEMIREGQFGGAINAHYSLPYATFISALLLVIGLVMCRGLNRSLVIE